MIELNQLPRKFDFPCTNVLDLSSQAKNVLEFSTETFINIANAFVLPRSLVRWEARPRFRFQTKHIGLASDDVRKPSNAWQRGKLVLNKDCVPYKSMLEENSLAVRSSLFFHREV